MLSKPFPIGVRMESSDSKKNMIDLLEATTNHFIRAKLPFEPSKRVYNGGWYYQGPEGVCGPLALATSLRIADVTPDGPFFTNLLNASVDQGSDFQLWRTLQDISQDRSFSVFRHHEKLEPNQPFLNAGIIKTILDAGAGLIIGVGGKFYFREDKGMGHAICLAGYEITPQRHMNIQVVDSNLGSVTVSLEHISKSVRAGYTFVVTKLSE